MLSPLPIKHAASILWQNGSKVQVFVLKSFFQGIAVQGGGRNCVLCDHLPNNIHHRGHPVFTDELIFTAVRFEGIYRSTRGMSS